MGQCLWKQSDTFSKGKFYRKCVSDCLGLSKLKRYKEWLLMGTGFLFEMIKYSKIDYSDGFTIL